MSYCRFLEGDVYVFTSADGIECCMCGLQEYEWVDDPTYKLFKGYMKTTKAVPHVFRSNQAMIHHLMEHRAAGHEVPEHALERLRDPEDEKANLEIWAKYDKERE
jgi:hypothetical protein